MEERPAGRQKTVPKALEMDINLGWKSQDARMTSAGYSRLGIVLSLFDFAVGIFPAN